MGQCCVHFLLYDIKFIQCINYHNRSSVIFMLIKQFPRVWRVLIKKSLHIRQQKKYEGFISLDYINKFLMYLFFFVLRVTSAKHYISWRPQRITIYFSLFVMTHTNNNYNHFYILIVHVSHNGSKSNIRWGKLLTMQRSIDILLRTLLIALYL